MTQSAAIDETLQRAIGPIPGLVAMATTRDGVIYQGAFGVRDVATGAPMQADSLFWYASMTKLLVSVAALQLVEEGQLDLDAPIADVLPELAHPQVLDGFAADGTPRLRPAASTPTLRQLLTHSAGYAHPGTSEAFGRYQSWAGLAAMPATYEDLAQWPLMFDPGADWLYGVGIDIVGKLIERVSGQRLDEVLSQRLLGPLGMADTTVFLSAPQRARLAAMHVRRDGGPPQSLERPVGTGPAFFMGGAAYCGTAADFIRFARMILNDGVLDEVRILSAATVAEMSVNHLGAPSVGEFITLNPAMVVEHLEFLPGIEKKWGTIAMINTAPAATGRRAGALFWAGVPNTFVWIDPAAGVAGVLLAQYLPFGDARALEAFEDFERAIYAGLASASRAAK